MNDSVREIYNAAEIAERVKTLAADISREYSDREVTLLASLDDSFVFLADLLRALKVPQSRTAFLRYDHRALGGTQDISFSAQTDVARRDLVLVEGVLETGVPQEYLMKQLLAQGAARIRLCVLVDKPARRRVGVEPDWRAFETYEDYVFGYGLGFQERWRHLPFLATFAGAEKTA